MLYYMGLLFLVSAVSMDGFVVGMTYGLRNIRVPFPAICIIMICSGTVVFLAMTIGTAFRSVISPDFTSKIGGVILICIGLFSIWNSLRSRRDLSAEEMAEDTSKKTNFTSNISSVISTPSKADINQSGRISMSEALLLGVALSMDAFGAGFGASMLGYTALMTTIFIAFMSGAFLFAGIHVGAIFAQYSIMRKLVYVPAAILIAIGSSTFF